MLYYFKVRHGTSTWLRFNNHLESIQKIRSLMGDFLKSHNIETSYYLLDTSRLIIYPTQNDEKVLKKQLVRRSLSEYFGLSDKTYRFFKLNSPFNIEWVNLCKNQDIKIDNGFLSFVGDLFFLTDYTYSYDAFASDDDFYIILNCEDGHLIFDTDLMRITKRYFRERKKNSVSLL